MRERHEKNWIQTYTGRKFWPTVPSADDLCIEDIAHALSLVNRYTGHTKWPYSVAQHSVIMSRECAEAPLWCLLHDASEAYLQDIARPIKSELTGYAELEEALMVCVAERFRLPLPMPICVHELDRVMLATERRDLMNHAGVPWAWADAELALPFRIDPWPWEIAEQEFLGRYKELVNVQCSTD